MDPRQSAGKSILILGALLTILGVGTLALLRGDPIQWASLTPALFGACFLALGLLVMKQLGWHRPLLFLAVALALLFVAGNMDGLAETAALLGGADLERPAEALEKTVAALLCVGFVGVSIRRIRSTRLQRQF